MRALEHPAVVLGACLAVALLAYGPSIGNGFYNDDALFLNLAGRLLDQPADLLAERPLGYFRPTYGAAMAVQRAAFGLAPAGYHAAGVLLHALTGWLVWRLARRALGQPLPALAAALAFVAFFSHSEGVLWIAAQNSVLAACLCVAAVLAHQRAAARGGVAPALLTAALVLLALCAKEPSAVLLAWLPLAEAALCGPRRLLTRGALLRYACVSVALLAWLAANARVGEAFAGDASTQGREIRATFGFVTVDGVLGATAWLWSPRIHGHAEARWWAGAAVLGGVLALTAWRRRDLLPAALLGAGLLLTAMVPASMTRFQQVSGSRLYYFPTVGAALLTGVAVACCVGRDGRSPLRWAALAALATWIVASVLAIRTVDRRDYAPVSLAQTRMARQLGELLRQQTPAAVVLVEPWLDNPMHLSEFVELYAGRPPARIVREAHARGEVAAWIERRRRLEPDVPIRDWSEADGLVPASGPPRGSRESAPGHPRHEADLAAGARVESLRVEWTRP